VTGAPSDVPAPVPVGGGLRLLFVFRRARPREWCVAVTVTGLELLGRWVIDCVYQLVGFLQRGGAAICSSRFASSLRRRCIAGLCVRISVVVCWRYACREVAVLFQ